MLLALVFSVQAATAPNPCADQMSMLCKISPLFCPSAYPSDLTPGNGTVPCWPEKSSPAAVSHDTRVVQRPISGSGQSASSATPSSATASSSPKADARSTSRVPARPSLGPSQ